MKTISPYLDLIRINKPTGIYLLLWPTLWALIIANKGTPSTANLIIFTLGTLIMRSLGCILNDIADKDIDHLVERTATRPITNNTISSKNAYFLAIFLLITASLLLIMLPIKVWYLAVIALLITACYPYGKRFIQCPQIILGIAFSWSIPMVFMAVNNHVSSQGWALFFISAIWPLIYDTQYAISDRPDDLKIGVNSSAIWFGTNDTYILNMLQTSYIALWAIFAFHYNFNSIFYLCLAGVAANGYYQHTLVKNHNPQLCQKAFKMHNYSGMLVFIGLLTNYL
jgi:4-hydroxybenzoate polyprenyltransferase